VFWVNFRSASLCSPSLLLTLRPGLRCRVIKPRSIARRFARKAERNDRLSRIKTNELIVADRRNDGSYREVPGRPARALALPAWSHTRHFDVPSGATRLRHIYSRTYARNGWVRMVMTDWETPTRRQRKPPGDTATDGFSSWKLPGYEFE